MTGAREALVIATTTHDDESLARLGAPAGDVLDLGRALGDPDVGGFRVETLLNAGSATIQERIEAFFAEGRSTDDLLLLYFSGHGVKDEAGHLYFAATNTRRGRLRSTAVSAAFVHDVMSSSRARQQVLVLDCCYSGAFARGLAPKADDRAGIGEVLGGVGERPEGRGRIVLTASDAVQYSFEDSTGSSAAPQSVFTRALVEGLETGRADLDGDGQITVDEWYEYSHDRTIESTTAQRPGKWAFGAQGAICVAKAPGGVPSTAPSPPTWPDPTGAPAGPSRRFPTGAIAAATIGAILLAVVVVVALSRGDDSDPDETATPAAAYPSSMVIEDDTGTISIQVPTAWSNVWGDGWNTDNFSPHTGRLGAGLNASTNNSSWFEDLTTPGLFIGASSDLATDYDPASTVQRATLDGCGTAGGGPYREGGLTGEFVDWECPGTSTRWYVLAAWPPEQDYIVYLQVKLVDERDEQALEAALDTFQVTGTPS